MSGVDRLLAERHIVVCTGSGGVGKTTTAAALALRAAESGRRTIVCTIDPARRLAQSLGLSELDHAPHRVGGPKGGELWAMMLDMKRTFDEMVLEMTTRERAEAIFRNPFYQHVSSTLAGTQEYMAMEKLWELHEEGRWELIVIDTPPTRSALDFIDAPRKLTDFLEGRFLRLMLWPYLKASGGGLRVLNVGARAVLRTVTRITGSELFTDVADFFQQFEGMYGTFKKRSVRVRELLGAKRTAFVVVTTPSPPSMREARYFLDRLGAERIPVGGVVVNRTHPTPAVPGLEDPRALAERAGAGPLAEVLRLFADRRETWVREEQALQGSFGRSRAPVWSVPELADEVHDLRTLREVGEILAAAPR